MLESIGWKGRTRLQANSLETQKKVVLLGRGFTVLPSFMIRKELEKGELVSIRLPKPLKSPVFLCHLKQFKPGLAYERYLEELKQCLRGLL
jgi:DNA-binding transcriptional LysR family regulator